MVQEEREGKGKVMPPLNLEIEYFDVKLSQAIKYFIEHALKKKDWTVIAIDPVKDAVVLRRYKEIESK